MPTKQQLYEKIQVYRARVCPKLNINSSKQEMLIAVSRIDNNVDFKRDPKKAKKAKTKSKAKLEPVVKSKDEIKKEIKELFKKYKDIGLKMANADTESSAKAFKKEADEIKQRISILRNSLR